MRACILPVVFFLAACGADKNTVSNQPIQPVRLLTVGMAGASAGVSVNGLVAARDELRLSFKTGGVVGRVPANEGERVGAGQVLAELQTTELDAGVTQAREQLAKAERDLARAQTLHDKGLVALQPVQDAKTAVDVARAQADSAGFNRRQAVLSAPGPGVVLRRLVEPGEIAAPGMPALVLADDRRGWVLRVGVADRVAVRLHKGDAAEVVLDAWPERPFKGRITQIAAASDPGTGTLAVEIDLDARDLHLASGLVGRATLHPVTEKNAPLAIPVGALLEADGDRAHVFLLASDGSHVQRRDIRVGEIRDEQVVVREGLRAGDRVVSEGAAWLNDGDAVRVVE